MASNGKLRSMTAVYLTCGDEILLLFRRGSRVVGDSWTGTAGGHFEKDELSDAHACAVRELFEETGLSENDISPLSLRYITLRSTKGEVRQNYYYFAEVAEKIEVSSNEGDLKWFYMDEKTLDMPMPFTAKHMLAHYFREGRNTDALYGGITDENGVTFIPMPEF